MAKSTNQQRKIPMKPIANGNGAQKNTILRDSFAAPLNERTLVQGMPG